jgi:hypothetical protein
VTRHDNGDLGLWFPWLREQLSSRLSSRLSSTDQFTHPWTEDLASRQAHLTKRADEWLRLWRNIFKQHPPPMATPA